MSRLLLVAMMPFLALGGPRTDVVFAGIVEGGAPSFERSFERLLREQLAMVRDFRLRDDHESVRFRKGIGLASATEITKVMLESIRKYDLDSAVFIFGSVEGYSIRGARRGLGSVLVGEASFALVVYSYVAREFAFMGSIRCTSRIRKDLVALYSVKNMHITAPQRAMIQEQLVRDAATRVLATITAIAGDDRPGEAVRKSDTVEEIVVTGEPKAPSISEIFDFPTAGAREIQTPQADSLGNPDSSAREEPQPDQAAAGDSGAVGLPASAADTARVTDSVPAAR